MKIFQRLLIAPATLGLLAPLAANANEVNFNEVSNYTDRTEISTNTFEPLSTRNPLLAGGEGLGQSNSDDFDADSFSSTTSATFSADFAVGSVDGVAAEDTVGMAYGYTIDLKTGFTGNDSLDVSLQAGIGDSGPLTELDLAETVGADKLGVDSITYTKSLGEKATVFFGNGADAGTLFTTACAYDGVTDTLDDCGNRFSQLGFSKGTVFGASYEVGNGFSGAFGYTGQGNKAAGLATAEGKDALGANIAYTGNSFGVSISYADVESPVEDGEYGGTDESSSIVEAQTWALNAYYTPDGGRLPSISAGVESASVEVPAFGTSDTDSSHWFIGLQWDEVGPGTLGAAIGTKQHYLDHSSQEEQVMYEAYYAYPINDGMTITPLLYVKENSADNTDDETGVITKLSFSF